MSGWIISSSVLIVAVIALRAVFRKKISPTLRYCLWLLVLLRLLLPMNIGESTASVLNHVPDFALGEAADTSYDAAPINAGEEAPFSPYVPELSENSALTQSESENGTPPVAAEKPNVKSIVLAIYLAGAVTVLAFVVISNIIFGSRLKRSRRNAGSFMGLRVYRSDILDTPCLFGLFYPVIYLSTDVNEESCKHVLLHEQAHYRQKDHVWAWLRGLSIALHWYNPLVWIAAKLSKQDGELSCDERVLSAIDEAERLEYGRTLISLSCGGRKPLLCAVTPLSAKGKALKERVEYIAHRPGMLLGNMALVIVAALIVTGCTFTGAKTEIPEPELIPQSSAQLPCGTLLDRDGEALTEENFPLYSSALSTFESYLNEGNTIKLTVDLELQQKAQNILEENLEALGAAGFSGCLVALDVKTGAPLAIAGMGEAVDPLTVSFTPGSLFMPCTALTALGAGVIYADDVIACEGVFDRYAQDGYAPACWIYEASGTTHAEETLSTALRDSCEYYFYCLGNDSGIDDMGEYAHALGLGVSSGIELPSSNGLMPDRMTAKSYGMQWHIGNTLETAVGEGLCSFTPLQLAQYCAAIANNGQRYSASIINEMTDSSGKVIYSRTPSVVGQIVNVEESGWMAVKEGLYLSLNNDSDAFTQAALEEMLGDWRVAGKTAAPSSGSLMSQQLFMGYAPYDDPEIAVVVLTITADKQGAAQQIAYELIATYKNLR